MSSFAAIAPRVYQLISAIYADDLTIIGASSAGCISYMEICVFNREIELLPSLSWGAIPRDIYSLTIWLGYCLTHKDTTIHSQYNQHQGKNDTESI